MDFMALQFPDFIIFNIYLLPDQSPWEKWSDPHPCQLLLEALAKTTVLDIPTYLLGNFNAAQHNGRALVKHDPHQTPQLMQEGDGCWWRVMTTPKKS